MSIRPESKAGGGDEATGCWDDGHAERFCLSLSESVTWRFPLEETAWGCMRKDWRKQEGG